MNRCIAMACLFLAFGVAFALAATLAAAEEPLDGEAALVASQNNMKRIMIAMQNHHDMMKAFPAAIMTEKGKPLLSWRVTLLRLFEDPRVQQLYNEFHLDEPWDSEHNKKLIERMPEVYQSPLSKLNDGRTVYLTPRGKATAFPGERAVRIRDIIDGTSKTLGLLEVDDARAVIWTKPDDYELDPQKPKDGLGGQNAEGFLAAFLDASVVLVPNTIDDDTLNKLFTHQGREPVQFDRQ